MFPERIRQRDDRTQGKIVVREKKWNSALITTADWLTTKSLGSTQTTLDLLPTPYKPGNLKISPFDTRKHEIYASADTFKLTGPVAGYDYWKELSGPIAGYFFTPTWNLQTGVEQDELAADLATAKAYAKVQEPDVNLLENLVEAKQTLEMFTMPLMGLIKIVAKASKSGGSFIPTNRFYKSVTRRGPRTIRLTPAEAAKRAADTWLQYRYGIMPLILSVEGLKASYQRHFKPKLPFERKSGRVASLAESQGMAYTSIGGVHFTWNESITVEKVCRREYFYISQNGLSKDLWSVGAHPRQYLSLAWELIPASFMLDWSLGIGDWLKQAAPAPHINLIAGFISWKYVNTCVRTYESCTADGDLRPDRACLSMAIARESKYYRIPGLPELGIPTFSRSPLNLQRSVDTISILQQQLINKLQKR